MQKLLYTYAEAAELLGVSHWTVRRWISAGRLSAPVKGKVSAGSLYRLAELGEDYTEGEDARGRHYSPDVHRTHTSNTPRHYRERPSSSATDDEFYRLLGIPKPEPKRPK